MSSPTDICNLALGKLAQDITITSFTERSKEARVYSRLWQPMRDLVLADRLWPWAMVATRLALEAQDALPGWRFRYSRPSDCITVVAVTDDMGMRAGRMMSLWCDPVFRQRHGSEFAQAYGEQGTTILSDQPEAWLIYVVRVEDPERFPPHFVDALACKLAEESAPTVIGEKGFTNKGGLRQLYQAALSLAAAHDLNESEVPGHEPAVAQTVRG